MDSLEQLRQKIRFAFKGVGFPGQDNLSRGHYGNEPALTSAAFRNATDWAVLSAEDIDDAPEGYATALAFFSDRAFQFYLPAYLLADIDRKLRCADPAFQLCHPFADMELSVERTASTLARIREAKRASRFAHFTKPQVEAVASYLKFKLNDSMWIEGQDEIEHALLAFWEPCSEIDEEC